MSKATCRVCGEVFPLEGKERWEIKEAMRYLIDKYKEHRCVKNEINNKNNLNSSKKRANKQVR